MMSAAVALVLGTGIEVQASHHKELLDGIPARGDDAERKSKNGRLDHEAEGVKVVVTYGRPSVRGRKVWGGLVQYGKIWRTGADEATTITFTKDVRLDGKKVAAGTYALFTIPGKNEWTWILNRQAKQWGAYKYDASADVARVKAKPASGSMAEALLFEGRDGAVVLRWGKLSVPLAFEAVD
ncbi:MAG: DUF2911 domain-containing protein [Myxococcota bacterium]